MCPDDRGRSDPTRCGATDIHGMRAVDPECRPVTMDFNAVVERVAEFDLDVRVRAACGSHRKRTEIVVGAA